MEYPSNSNGPKQDKAPAKETKKIEQIVTGDIVRKKPSLGKRFMETFVGGDAQSVWGYVAYDVLLPAAKDMISDAVSTGIERMLFGEGVRSPSSRGRSASRGSNGYVSYNRYAQGSSGSRGREAKPDISRRGRATHNFDEIIIPTRAEAEAVIEALDELVDRFGNATVADMYDAVGITPEFTDNKHGWTDLRSAKVTRIREGYLLDLPRTEPID